jgi:hypothetical protein
MPPHFAFIDFAQILGVAASADPERYCTNVKVFLGGAKLR